LKKNIKQIVKLFIPRSILSLRRKSQNEKEYFNWLKNGRQIPVPHIAKQKAIEEYQDKYQYPVFIETGTYLGDMVDAQKKRFRKLISIEIGQDLAAKAKERFIRNKNVLIIQGDSGKILYDVLKDIEEPVIFWLDGHYSAGITAKGEKDCPIFEELDAIFRKRNNKFILLIDDARCFNGSGDYPTKENLISFIKNKNEYCLVDVKDDIIRFIV
jgi:hypothetical protein